jgi:uncharacterized membrane protein
MNTRLALLNYCLSHNLDSPTSRGLWNLAAFDRPPQKLQAYIRPGLAAVSALLVGAGLICWVAANWSSFGRTLQFGLLESLVLISCIGATVAPALRTGLALFALLAIGALFAFYGQTYQTGADPWQLFALWSLLGLPLVIAVSSEAIRVVWIAVSMTAIALWTMPRSEMFHHTSTLSAAVGCSMALLLALSMSRQLRHITGAGPYASGVAIVSALCLIIAEIGPAIFRNAIVSALPILTILLASFIYSRPAYLDVLALNACALSLNFLVDTNIVNWVLNLHGLDVVTAVGTIGVAASGLCGISVCAILYVLKQAKRKGDIL